MSRLLDRIDTEKQQWQLFVSGVAVGTAHITRTLLRKGWRKTRGEDPPLNPATPGTDWSDAIIWTLAISVGVGVARLLARRAAAESWQKVRGAYPPGMEEQ